MNLDEKETRSSSLQKEGSVVVYLFGSCLARKRKEGVRLKRRRVRVSQGESLGSRTKHKTVKIWDEDIKNTWKLRLILSVGRED